MNQAINNLDSLYDYFASLDPTFAPRWDAALATMPLWQVCACGDTVPTAKKLFRVTNWPRLILQESITQFPFDSTGYDVVAAEAFIWTVNLSFPSHIQLEIGYTNYMNTGHPLMIVNVSQGLAAPFFILPETPPFIGDYGAYPAAQLPIHPHHVPYDVCMWTATGCPSFTGQVDCINDLP